MEYVHTKINRFRQLLKHCLSILGHNYCTLNGVQVAGSHVAGTIATGDGTGMQAAEWCHSVPSGNETASWRPHVEESL